MTASNNPNAPEELAEQVKRLTDEVTRLQKLIAATKPDDRVLHDTARAAYAEYGNQIRHFSTVRSTLTVFLVTAGMTAFAGYLDKKIVFLVYAGAVFAVAAVLVCLRFSYLTEKHVILYKDTWHLLNPLKGKRSEAVFGNLDWDAKKGIWPRVLMDKMNWLLILAAGAFLIYVYWTYSHPAMFRPDDLQ